MATTTIIVCVKKAAGTKITGAIISINYTAGAIVTTPGWKKPLGNTNALGTTSGIIANGTIAVMASVAGCAAKIQNNVNANGVNTLVNFIFP